MSSKNIITSVALVLGLTLIILGFIFFPNNTSNDQPSNEILEVEKIDVTTLTTAEICNSILNNTQIASILNTDLSLDIVSPNEDSLKTCSYTFENSSILTVMIINGSNAEETYDLNVDSIAVDSSNLITDFEVGEKSIGFNFGSTTAGDFYANNTWVNASVSGDLDNSSKTQVVKLIAMMVL